MKDQFVMGYCCAVATIVRGHGAGTETEEALSYIGVKTVKDLRSKGVDEFDIEALKPVLKTNRDRKRRWKTREKP